MVKFQLAGRGITDQRVLDAFRSVPREEFLSEDLAEFAYRDTPLPISEGQTISQPYIVALTIDALKLRGDERVLEIGTGSGYAAAVLSRLVKEVFTVERLEPLTELARARLVRLGYRNVQVLHGDGTLGWPEHAPYDAIAVAAGGPEIPKPLRSQMSLGGRMVIPVGSDESSQLLVRLIREDETQFREEDLASVRFVPLIGEQGWLDGKPPITALTITTGDRVVSKLIHAVAEVIGDIDSAPIDALLERIGHSQEPVSSHK